MLSSVYYFRSGRTAGLIDIEWNAEVKILKQTRSELVLCHQLSGFVKRFLIAWSLGFVGIPMVMLSVLFYGLGVTRLDCQRLEVSQVRCDRQQSKLLDLIRPPAESFFQVTAARMKVERGWETRSNDSRRIPTVDRWVVLETSLGEVTFVEDVVRVNGQRGSAAEMQGIANDINAFLISDRDSLSLRRDLRFRLGQSILPIAFSLVFIGIGGVVLVALFSSEVWFFDGIKRQLICDRKTLIGTKTWRLPFRRIRSVTMDVETDSDGDNVYRMALELDRGKPRRLPSVQNQREAETIRDALREFLRL